MTTVAYRDGVIAADTGMTIGGVRVGTVGKIARNSVGDLAGGAGSAPFVKEFLSWFLSGEPEDEPIARLADDCIDRGIIIRRNEPKVIHVLEPAGRYETHCDYYALGSGREVALGALFAGAVPIVAVQAARTLDDQTWGEVQQLEANNGSDNRGRKRGPRRR